MQSKEKAYWEGYIQKQNETMEICKQCKYRNKARELETQKQEIIEKLEKKIKDITSSETYDYVGSEWQESWVVEELEGFLKIVKGEKE